MIKKYFALSIIALSVAVTAGCSSDDDDDDGGVTDGGVTAGGETAGGDTAGGDTAGGDTAGGDTAGGETAGGDTAGGDTAGGEPAALDDPIPGSGLAAIVASPDHGMLEAALIANPAVYNALNAADTTVTIFAPTDAAFAEYDAAVTASLADTDDSIDDLATLAELAEGAVARILTNHVVAGQFTVPLEAGAQATLAAEDATTTPAQTAQMLTFGADGAGASTVSSSFTVAAAAEIVAAASVDGTEDGVEITDQDVLISIPSLLLTDDVDYAAPVATTPPPGGGGAAAGAAGDIETLLDAQTATFANATAGIVTAYGAAFNNAQWTLFLPDDTVATAELSEAAMVGHAVSNITVDQAGLEALIGQNILNANSSSESGTTYVAAEIAVAGSAGAVTVGGFAVTYLGQVTSADGATLGAQVFSIAGSLPDAALAP